MEKLGAGFNLGDSTRLAWGRIREFWGAPETAEPCRSCNLCNAGACQYVRTVRYTLTFTRALVAVGG